MNSPDVVLELLLEKNLLLEIIKDTHANAKEDEIKNIDKMLQETGVDASGSGDGGTGANGKHNTKIDKLLQHELNDANRCKKCEQPKAPADKGVARNLEPLPAGAEESEEEEEEEDNVEEEGGADETEVAEETVAEVEETTQVNVCSIVGGILTKDNLEAACKLKYDGKYYGWKCVPTTSGGDNTTTGSESEAKGRQRRDTDSSGNPTSDKGSICIPPRRRKMYIGPLKTWADNSGSNTVVSGEARGSDSSQGTTSATASESPKGDSLLLTAFVESAAVETFFLWHKYKAENTKTQGVDGARGGYVGGAQSEGLFTESRDGMSAVAGGGVPSFGAMPQGDVESIQLKPLGVESDDPQNKLQNGHIPPDFLRQMFYTFGDYRDILFGKDISGDKNIETIKNKIDKILPKNGDTPPPAPKSSAQTPDKWWDDNAKHIWNGMICALSYNTKDKEIIKLAHHNLTSKEIYKYNNVTFIGGFNSDKNSKTETSATKLEEFSRRPTFFRWLEEWGEDFCRKRNDKLKNVKKECRGKYPNGDKQYCSGDGHDCEKTYLKHNDMFADLNCRRCGEQCRNYKQWIEKKLEEFHKQKSIYEKEIPKLKDNYNNHHYKNFYEQIIEKNGYSSFKKFLESFNQRKVCQGNSDQTNNTDFNEPLKTFSLSTYCKTCPLNGLNCGSKECNEVKGKGATWESVLNGKSKDYRRTTGINVEMIDRRGKYIEKHTQDSLFKESSLLKSVRDQKWECTFINDKMDICKLNNYNESIDMNKYTTFKVFLENWLQDFLEGYYISKRKIEICTENGENKCIKGCKGKCECVKEWLNKKSTEWKQIKERYKVHHDSKGYDIAHKVRSYFEKNESDVNKSIDNYE
ncbi:hypothetical protein PFNF135_06183, partial [Plasmodium falciparum NF135/5.C10]